MNTGTNDSSMISTEKKIGRPTVRQGSITSSRMSPVTLLVAKVLLEMVRGVFGHHDGLIDQDADRDRDPGQRHDVGLDVDDARSPQHPHHQETRTARPRGNVMQITNTLRKCIRISRMASEAMSISCPITSVSVWMAPVISRVRS